MKSVQFNQNLDKLLLPDSHIHLLHVKTMTAQKFGLLNHRILPKEEGILFSKKRWFHTFGMRFSICVLAFDKNHNVLAQPVVISPNRVFKCPLQSSYVVEMNPEHLTSIEHESIEHEFKTQNKIYTFNALTSKFVFYFFKILPFFVFFLALICTISNVFALNDIQLNIGKTRTIHLENAPQSIQIEDPDILELERVGISNSIRIIPKQPGKTSITLQYIDANEETINIQVSTLTEKLNSMIEQSQYQSNPQTHAFANSLRQIKKIGGVQSSVNAGKIFILGNVKSIETFQQISKIVAPNPNLFFPGFDLDSSIENKVMDSLNTDIRVMGEQNLKIIRSGNHFLLKGVHTSENAKEKVWSYIRGTMPNVIDASSGYFGESSLVQINLEFFEVGRANKKDVGFQYPTLGAGGVGLSVSSDNFSKPTFQITPFSVFFRALSARNFVREIANPVIITRSGEKATFLAGGEVPIPTANYSGPNVNVSVSFKAVGILFDVTPKVNDDGTIWVKLNIEYSQVNEQLSYQKSPGFNSRKVSTNIVLNEGNAAIISGLIQNRDIKKLEGIPLLSSIPILGELFKSKNYENDSTELWVAITAQHKNVETMNTSKNLFISKDSGLL